MVLKKVRVGVIDVGSNSVRLVIYDELKRVPIPIFNEKIMCALGKDIHKTKKLNKSGKKSAKNAIIRFVYMAHLMQVKKLFVFATAAVRESKDGKSFILDLEQHLNIKIKILSGKTEAKLAGLGVIAAIPEASGIIGDMGGGSFELAEVDNGQVIKRKITPLGALKLLGISSNGDDFIYQTIHENLSGFDQFEINKINNFYAVGGGFRNLAKAYITLNNYPLKILHNYKVQSKKLDETLNRLINMSSSEINQLDDISDNRSETLKYTAMLMKYIIDYMQPENVIFSVYGVREGILFKNLAEEEQIKDPLIAGSVDFISKNEQMLEYSTELTDWVKPLFTEEDINFQRLLSSICILSNIARFEHPEYRAEIAFRRFLDSSIIGISHHDRLFIATALYYCYSSTIDESIDTICRLFLDKNMMSKTKSIGYAIRLAYNITAGSTGIISSINIDIKNTMLNLKFDIITKNLIGEVVEKHLTRLAENMKLTPKIAIE